MEGKGTCLRGKWEKFRDNLAEKKVKPEKFNHLHLVYHLTVPLNLRQIYII